jgi:hypothetical protein
MSSSPPVIRRREIGQADLDRIVDLSTRGFRVHGRSRDFWQRALARLSAHRAPPGYPMYGYLLECSGTPVGVTLMVYSTIVADGRPHIRCSVSSWYLEPAYRIYLGQLASPVFRQEEVTFVNGTPGPHTVPVLEAMGYKRYCAGRFAAVPVLSSALRGVRVRTAAPDIPAGGDLSGFETQLLLDHRSYGCISVICQIADRRYPFVFQPRRKAGLMPFAFLVYCRRLEEFVRFAGSLGRFLAVRGIPLVIVDAEGAIAGLVGRYCDGFPKNFRGPEPPCLGDSAYLERAMFGF